MDPELERQLRARITELEGQVTTLTASSATLTTERDTARTQLTAQAAAVRDGAIVALFGEKHGLTDVQLGVYRGMSPDQFAETQRLVAAARASGDANLFRQVATEGRDEGGAAGAAKLFAAPVGYTVDAASANLHAKALKYQREHANVDYFTAVTAVSEGA